MQLKGLGRINILVGINNAGKTSILEGISIYSHPLDLREWWLISSQREREDRFMRTSTMDSLRWLFPQQKRTNADRDLEEDIGEILISSEGHSPISQLRAKYEVLEELRPPRRRFTSRDDESGIAELIKGLELSIEVELGSIQEEFEQLDLDIKYNEADNVSSREFAFQIWEDEPSIRFPRSKRRRYKTPVETVTPTSHRSETSQFRLLSEASHKNFKEDVVSLLREVDSNINDIEILADTESTSSRTQFQIYIQHNEIGSAPLSTFGDGIRRLLHIALKLARVKGGFLLIDELESTIHTEALQASYAWLVKWCVEMDVQLFATTHSIEAVDALLGVTDLEDDLVLYRLEPEKDCTRVTRHNWKRLKILREELGQEVRW